MLAAPKTFTTCCVAGCTVSLKDDEKSSSRLGTCLKHRTELAIEIKGNTFRYCQQCIKLHPLEEFERSNRGCKRRLLEHNRRFDCAWPPSSAPRVRRCRCWAYIYCPLLLLLLHSGCCCCYIPVNLTSSLFIAIHFFDHINVYNLQACRIIL